MSDEQKPGTRLIAREELELVIRRAVELVQTHSDSDDAVSEAELIRIASELGLPAEKVRQALYERPQLEVEPKWYDRYFDRPVVSAARVIPTPANDTLRRMEEYICAKEYMQLIRRSGSDLKFIPAEDAISRMARGLSRPGSRYHLAHARRVVVNVQSLEKERTHVRIDTDFSEQRESSVRSSLIAGGTLGALSGVIPAAIWIESTLGGAGGVAAMIASIGVSVAAGMGIAVRIAANGFSRKMELAKRELDGLLDRAEHSERLEPPPAPWRRSLSARFFGSKN